MKREQKIKLLQAVKARLLMPEDIRRAKTVVVIENLEGGYAYGDKHLTNDELKKLERDIEESSQRRVNCGLDPDFILVIEYKKGETIL